MIFTNQKNESKEYLLVWQKIDRGRTIPPPPFPLHETRKDLHGGKLDSRKSVNL